MIDKQFMIQSLNFRIEALLQKYRRTFDVEPSKVNYNSVTVTRSRVLQQINTCKLLNELCKYMPDDASVEDNDACKAFNKIVEPRRINNAY